LLNSYIFFQLHMSLTIKHKKGVWGNELTGLA
jgi:hypothetical protein